MALQRDKQEVERYNTALGIAKNFIHLFRKSQYITKENYHFFYGFMCHWQYTVFKSPEDALDFVKENHQSIEDEDIIQEAFVIFLENPIFYKIREPYRTIIIFDRIKKRLFKTHFKFYKNEKYILDEWDEELLEDNSLITETDELELEYDLASLIRPVPSIEKFKDFNLYEKYLIYLAASFTLSPAKASAVVLEDPVQMKRFSAILRKKLKENLWLQKHNKI